MPSRPKTRKSPALSRRPPRYPHWWIPVIVVDTNAAETEQQRAEECRLCGTFRNGATPDPPEAKLPCPFPPPRLPRLTAKQLRDPDIVFKCRVCGTSNAVGAWEFSGKLCPQCGGRHGAIRA